MKLASIVLMFVLRTQLSAEMRNEAEVGRTYVPLSPLSG
jgi:hypothetical protein